MTLAGRSPHISRNYEESPVNFWITMRKVLLIVKKILQL
jgi:hypothetical protein